MFFGVSLFAQKNPVMTFKEYTHNFGDVKQENGPAKVTFEFTNTGKLPIVITDVQTSCHCTTPQYSKQPVPPGAKGFIDVVYDAASVGQFSKTITVTSNAANSPVVLNINGNVVEKQNSVEEQYPQQIGDLRINNSYLNLGNVYNNEIKTQNINIINTTLKDMTIDVDSQYTSNFVTAKIEPPVLKPNQTGLIEVSLDGSKVNDWEYVNGILALKVNGQQYSARPIQISAIINEYFTDEQIKNAPKMSFEENTFDFDTITEGQVIEHVFRFTNVGKSDLLIRKTSTTCGCTAVNLSNDHISQGRTGEIKVTFNSAHKSGQQIKLITIIINAPDPDRKQILKINGFVKQAKH